MRPSPKESAQAGGVGVGWGGVGWGGVGWGGVGWGGVGRGSVFLKGVHFFKVATPEFFGVPFFAKGSATW